MSQQVPAPYTYLVPSQPPCVKSKPFLVPHLASAMLEEDGVRAAGSSVGQHQHERVLEGDLAHHGGGRRGGIAWSQDGRHFGAADIRIASCLLGTGVAAGSVKTVCWANGEIATARWARSIQCFRAFKGGK